MSRKYNYTLPDGRVVSRQRVWQLKHPEKQAVINKRFRQSESGKRSYRMSNLKWMESHPGYRTDYYNRVTKLKNLYARLEKTKQQIADHEAKYGTKEKTPKA